MTRPTEQQFCVHLQDALVGRLHRRDDVTQFLFDESYLLDAERAVLGLRFEDELPRRHRAHMRLPPWFSNLLPEGRLREWIAAARGTSPQREMELLARVGHDLPGAVTVQAAQEPVPVELASTEEGGPPRLDAPASLWSFSLAGVALKFSMLQQGDRFAAPAVGDGGDWIVKLPDPTYQEVPRNELAMMALARAAGIDVPETRLVHRDQIASLPARVWGGGECYAYAVRRFDRGLDRHRIHIEDFAQVRGFYPEDKYSGTFETVAALYYRGHDVASLQEFVRRLAFNVLIGNGDAHLKNWSLIYRNPRVPTISPAYDLVATAVYRPGGLGPEDMGLRFNGSRRFETVRLSSFGALDRVLHANAGLEDVASDLVRRVCAEWESAASLLEPVAWLRSAIGDWLHERAAKLLG